ncbi:hypothetical protein [Flavobacterium sp. 1355]|uniref:hypothetical protein n=1 Tax=Flavobacterium sp. 1355 TaxID=2806571 RepID=UPI001AE5677C|nr:hypothetical protein [Flavobacterium sp. 1355]MBP1223682.1 hypothetical protein [Flavobacterium sp. 1355]
MKKILLLSFSLLFISCISKKEYAALESDNKSQKDEIIILKTKVDSISNLLLQLNSDSDRDGIMDRFDECPQIEGTIANRGCPELTSSPLIEFCCSNHTPGHCATEIEEMINLCSHNRCIFK